MSYDNQVDEALITRELTKKKKKKKKERVVIPTQPMTDEGIPIAVGESVSFGDDVVLVTEDGGR